MRRDTPPFIRDAQMGIIKVLTKAPNSKAFEEKISESVEVLHDYVEKLMTGNVDLQDLFTAKQLSMHPNRYAHDVFQAIAAKKLIKAGVEVSAGQTVRYLITGAWDKRASRRVKAVELVNEHTRYDAEKYVDMLILAATNILSPFGYTERMLKDPLVYGEKPMVLEPVYA